MSVLWTALRQTELRELLAGVANGARPRGEVSDCGRYLVALYEPAHPLSVGLWEVWTRDEHGWRPSSSWRGQEEARRAAERLGAGQTAAAARRTG